MASETFRNKIKQELKKLNRKQVINFSWRCAVRALPFLGSTGSFNFLNNLSCIECQSEFRTPLALGPIG